MMTDHAPEASVPRFLRFGGAVVGWGLGGAAGVGGLAGTLKWLVGGLELGAAMAEAVRQGFPLLGFILGGAVASFRALYAKREDVAYRAGVGIALGAAFFLVWSVLAVGGIGAGGAPDLSFAGVLAIGVVGVLLSRFEPLGMARALTGVAAAQAAIPVIAIAAGWHRLPGASLPEIVLYSWFFAAAFAASAALFQKAARAERATSSPSNG